MIVQQLVLKLISHCHQKCVCNKLIYERDDCVTMQIHILTHSSTGNTFIHCQCQMGSLVSHVQRSQVYDRLFSMLNMSHCDVEYTTEGSNGLSTAIISFN